VRGGARLTCSRRTGGGGRRLGQGRSLQPHEFRVLDATSGNVRLQGAYPVLVNGLLPAQLQAEYGQPRGYAGNKDVPVLRDDGDLSQAIARIRARRVELLDLARSEAAFATARWYELMRIKEDLEEMIIELAAWDRDPVPLAELLSSCVAPRRPSAGPELAVTPPSGQPRQPEPSTGVHP